MSAQYWVDIIEVVVASVRTDASMPSGLPTGAPFYLHGHPRDVVDVMAEKDQSDTQKLLQYPLIALFQDFEEGMGEDQQIASRASLNLIIATNTKMDYHASERYNATFRTVLYPIYDIFIRKVYESKYFANVGINLCPHTKIDRLYWGREGLYGNEGNIFNDAIDAIEIRNLQLDLMNRKRCT